MADNQKKDLQSYLKASAGKGYGPTLTLWDLIATWNGADGVAGLGGNGGDSPSKPTPKPPDKPTPKPPSQWTFQPNPYDKPPANVVNPMPVRQQGQPQPWMLSPMASGGGGMGQQRMQTMPQPGPQYRSIQELIASFQQNPNQPIPPELAAYMQQQKWGQF